MKLTSTDRRPPAAHSGLQRQDVFDLLGLLMGRGIRGAHRSALQAAGLLWFHSAISSSGATVASRRSPVVGWLWRLWLRLQFLLFGRRRHNRLVLEHVAGMPLVVLPEVLNPKLFRTGEFLAQTLDERLVPPGAAVLDMGTGSGVGAVFAAGWARRVVAVDINPEAVRCARINTLLHNLEERVDVREGDLFAPVVDEHFDLVLFNPPYLRGTPRSVFEQAIWATDVVERFAAGLGQHLAPGGSALVLLSTIGDLAAFLELFQAHGFVVETVAERDLVTEQLIIYRLTLNIER